MSGRRRKYVLVPPERFDEIAQHIIEERAYKNIKENFKNDKNASVEAMYMAYVSRKLMQDIQKQIKKGETTLKQDGKVLNLIAEFENTTGHLDNLIENQNKQYENDYIEKVIEDKSPFEITKERAKSEMKYTKESKDTELEMSVKDLFWINRSTKNIEIMLNSIVAKKAENILKGDKDYEKYDDEKKVEKREEIQKEVYATVKKVYSAIAENNKVEQITSSYESAIVEKGGMNKFKSSLENARIVLESKDVLKQQENLSINDKEKISSSKHGEILDDQDFLAQSLMFLQASGYMYLAKEYYIDKVIEKRLDDRDNEIEDGVRVGTCETGRENEGADSCMLVVSMQGYNSTVRVHVEKDRIASYKAGENLDFEGRINPTLNRQNALNDAILLKKHTPEEFENLEKLKEELNGPEKSEIRKNLSIKTIRQVYAALDMNELKENEHLYGATPDRVVKYSRRTDVDWRNDLNYASKTKESAIAEAKRKANNRGTRNRYNNYKNYNNYKKDNGYTR